MIFLVLLFSFQAHALVLSPRGVELPYSFESEFITSSTGKARELVLSQSMHLFAYLQNESIGGTYGLRPSIGGVGAPRWEPEIELLLDRKAGGQRLIRYRMKGEMLLLREVAERHRSRKEIVVQLPYDLDHYYDRNCTDEKHFKQEAFWYFGNPFGERCPQLREEPLARNVTIELGTAAKFPRNKKVGLAELWGDNGNGEVFEITSINGFDESATKPTDEGRVNFFAMNEWFVEQGFRETVLARFKNRPLHQFEKSVRRADGSELLVRVLRLLVDADLDSGRNVTFSKFLQKSLRDSDVVIFEGHSGSGARQDPMAIEKRLLRSKDKKTPLQLEFDRKKRQIFFFDACSSYSYFLGLFTGRKDPDTLAVISNGLSSLFGFEQAVTKHLYRNLINGKKTELEWLELLEEMEKPLRGNTFLLNVHL